MSIQPITIFTQVKSPRLDYIFRFIFEEILHLHITFTENLQEINECTGLKINYSDTEIPDCLQFRPHSVILHGTLTEQHFDLVFFERFFREEISMPDTLTSDQDPIGFSFYIISRYEEYLTWQPDRHGRFEASESLLFKNNWLDIPVIDVFCKKLIAYFKGKGFNINLKNRYHFINTIDIDQAYAILYKGIGRTIGGAVSQLLKGNFSSLSLRFKVLAGKQMDPFDCFSYLEKIRERYNLDQIYFFLAGDYGQYDKNISYHSPGLKKILEFIKDFSSIGIHPSYRSHKMKTTLIEKKRLEEISGKQVTLSRQHFLKIHLPQTYHELIKAGIREDYSMGFASQPGFRAGTCQPFYWYDLVNENPTLLKIYPVTIMEGTLSGYMQINAADALPVYSDYISVCKKYQGSFISIFHNESVSEYGKWKGWRSVYEQMIQLATEITKQPE